MERLFNFIRQTLFIFPALYCVRGRKKREEKLCEMKTVDAAGKEEASLSEPNKEKSSALSWRMESAGSHREDKKVKVKIVLI